MTSQDQRYIFSMRTFTQPWKLRWDSYPEWPGWWEGCCACSPVNLPSSRRTWVRFSRERKPCHRALYSHSLPARALSAISLCNARSPYYSPTRNTHTSVPESEFTPRHTPWMARTCGYRTRFIGYVDKQLFLIIVILGWSHGGEWCIPVKSLNWGWAQPSSVDLIQ